MIALLAKALLAGTMIAAISTIAQSRPAFGALIASLPLVSILGMIFLWTAQPDRENMAAHSAATFWYVLPSLPMFLLIPWLLRSGMAFWAALLLGCLLTIALYFALERFGPRIGIPI